MTLPTNADPVAARSPAEVYEAEFVPALFRPFAGAVLDAAAVGRGQRVLDVACGTGVLARAAAARVGAGRRRAPGSTPTPRCWRWRAGSTLRSNGFTAAPNRCRCPMPASMRS